VVPVEGSAHDLMAAESVQEVEPVANGTEHTTDNVDIKSAAEQESILKDGQHKMSAAEKRRQRKKKNKQAKQIERCYTESVSQKRCGHEEYSVSDQLFLLTQG